MPTGPEKKVLVTGGLGYIGGRVIAYLINHGYQVTLTSRRSPDQIPALFWPEADVIQWNPSGHVVPDLSGFYAVIHLAAANEIISGNEPLRAIDDTIKGTVNILKAAKNAAIKTFIYMSTIHVYGSPLIGNVTEELITRPVHPYAITHKAAEDFVLAARARSDMNAIVFRLSNSFGPPVWPGVDRWSLLVNDLCRNVVNTGKLQLLSDGTQVRDFITLTDVCAALGHFLKLDKPASLDGLFNLGGKKTISIIGMTRKIADQYKKLTGKTAVIERPEPAESKKPIQEEFSFSIHHLESTGFHLSGSIEEELNSMLNFCQEHFKGQSG